MNIELTPLVSMPFIGLGISVVKTQQQGGGAPPAQVFALVQGGTLSALVQAGTLNALSQPEGF